MVWGYDGTQCFGRIVTHRGTGAEHRHFSFIAIVPLLNGKLSPAYGCMCHVFPNFSITWNHDSALRDLLARLPGYAPLSENPLPCLLSDSFSMCPGFFHKL